MDIIVGLAKKYNVKVIDVSIQTDYYERVQMPEDTYIEKSYCNGNEIILGIYSSPEKCLAAFFHELGHMLCENGARNKYDEECRAWQHGFKLAKDENITFSEETIKWCRQQLSAYKL
jgi:hypothetical protein